MKMGKAVGQKISYQIMIQWTDTHGETWVRPLDRKPTLSHHILLILPTETS